MMTAHRIRRLTLWLSAAPMLIALCLRVSRADDDPAATPEPLTVRDAGVYLLSAYGTNLNDRGLFKSTLPGYTLSRRPSAPRSDANTPAPLSLITFSGPPTEDNDVLLEFDNGRFLSHWPPARMRSKRLLWSGLSTTLDAPEVPARMAEDHWLSPLRGADRLYAASRGRCDRALLYDAELKYKPHVTLKRENTGFRVTNEGNFAIHDVHIYRPANDGQWSVWKVDTVGASKKVKPPKGDSDPDGDESGVDSQEEVFDKADGATADGAEASADEADESVEGDAASAVTDESPAEGEGEEPTVASGQKAGLAAFIAKVKSGELPASTKDGADDASQGAGDTTVDATEVGTLTVEEALQNWTGQLLDLGLGDSEAAHITTILKAQALRTDTTMLVYRMDDAHLEKVLPLEVTPYPDRLFRVALVIVQDADPDLQLQIEQLVKQLGNEDWPLRQAAQDQLAALGLAAKPKLEEALKSEDAEVVFRAEQLLEEIQKKP